MLAYSSNATISSCYQQCFARSAVLRVGGLDFEKHHTMHGFRELGDQGHGIQIVNH